MNARSKLICGAILGNILGWVVLIFGSLCVENGELQPMKKNAGWFAFGCGVIIVGAYSYLFLVVLANKTDLLPKGACKWCCYGPLVYGCIESYRQEIVFETIPTTP